MSDLYFIEESNYSEKNFSAPPFFNHFSLSLNRQKRAVMRAIRKKLGIVTLQLPTYYILEQKISIGANADIAKTKREIQIVFVVKRWMQCLLFPLKSQSARKLSCHPGFMGNFLTISHKCQPYLPSQQISSSFCSCYS